MKIGKKDIKITDKKLLCIIISAAVVFVAGVVALILFLLGDEIPKPPSEPMELMCKTLDSEYDFALIGDDGEEVLKSSDVDAVYIMYIKGENRYLEIRFKDTAVEKFEDAIDDYDELAITLDGEILVEGIVANKYYPDRARLDGKYETIMIYFNEMT